MNSKNYKIYRKHQLEIFNMIYDIIERAPIPDDLAFFFGTETKAQREEFNKKCKNI